MFGLGIPTLVIRKFHIDENGSEGKFIEIEGRATGLISWILTILKLDTLTILQLKGDQLKVKASSLSGEVHTVMPLSAIETTQCGFSKSLIWLNLAVIAFLYGVVSGDGGVFLLMLLLAVVFGAIYYFSKRIFLSATAGDTKVAIAFKKGVMEGTNIDFDRTLTAIQLLNKLVLDINKYEK
jgi:hypothetical protein